VKGRTENTQPAAVKGRVFERFGRRVRRARRALSDPETVIQGGRLILSPGRSDDATASRPPPSWAASCGATGSILFSRM
jgi:hypothetical protein